MTNLLLFFSFLFFPLFSSSQVGFINDQGIAEAGIDGGGLLKEYLEVLTQALVDPARGLFVPTSGQLLVPNPVSSETPLSNNANANYGDSITSHVQLFEFAGKVFGKALYEGILIESEFCATFLNLLLGQKNQLDDLVLLDESLYRGILELKHYALQGGDVGTLDVFFEAPRVHHDGRVSAVELRPGGSTLRVTKENYIEYMILLANFKLNAETMEQSQAFLRGFRTLIPVSWLKMFSAPELKALLGGSRRSIDLEDLRAHTKYGSGYHPSQPYMQAFWKILEEMEDADQASLLKFVTSCSRQPLLGFAVLNPPFCIQKVPTHQVGDAAGSSARLPSASTCMNLFKLPQYDTIEELQTKLLYAVRSNSGFELS